MTAKERETKALVKRWQRQLHLGDWNLTVNFKELPVNPDSDSTPNAGIWRSTYYKNAELRFNEDWQEWTNEELRQTVLHELLHLKFRDLDELVDEAGDLLSKQANTLLYKTYRRVVEGLIDDLAEIFHGQLP